MSTFDKREKSFEGKFAHDEEILFKVLARAKKMLGRWLSRTSPLISSPACRPKSTRISSPPASPSPSIRLLVISTNSALRRPGM